MHNFFFFYIEFVYILHILSDSFLYYAIDVYSVKKSHKKTYIINLQQNIKFT